MSRYKTIKKIINPLKMYYTPSKMYVNATGGEGKGGEGVLRRSKRRRHLLKNSDI